MSETEPDTTIEQPEAAVEQAPVPAPKKRRGRPKKSDAAPDVKENEEAPASLHKQVPEPFLQDLNELANLLETTPTLIDPIREVFEYHLVDPIDRKTFPKIVNAMSMLLGTGPTMVLMTACHVNSAAFFEDLLFAVKDNEKTKAALWIIQHLTSLYGIRMQLAYTLSSGTMDEDWHTIDVNTYRREGETPSWIVETKLQLYNGEQSYMRMTPDSAFQLAAILITELAHNVPLEQIDDALVKKCREDCTVFFGKFYNKKDEAKEEEHPVGYA